MTLLRAAALLALIALIPRLPAAASAERPPVAGRAAAGADPDVLRIKQLSIEELLEVEITSVSRRAEPLGGAAASVFVITNQDIRRSGVTSLPEALRLAPNLQVAREDAVEYSITARGSGGFQAANKLLVLVDGRSVYSPIFAGVFWDALHVPLDDVERIEVISGPGGSLYGANAVNGVINIVTRAARDTRGGAVLATLGDVDQTFHARWGGALGDDAAYRVYAARYDRGASRLESGAYADDAFGGYQFGFRADWSGRPGDLTLQGDWHDNEGDDGQADRGGNVLARWARPLSARTGLEVLAWYDRVDRESVRARDELQTFEARVQLSTRAGRRHTIVAGSGYRTYEDTFTTKPPFTFFFDPATRRTTLADVFVQDSIALSDAFTLTLGSKFEYSSYTDEMEVLPSVRGAWRLGEHTLLWGAVSRAIRSPSRFDRDLRQPGVIAGGPDFKSEELIAYELGYRGALSPRVSAAATLFYNEYDDLRTSELTDGGLPLRLLNNLAGHSYGVEAWASAQLLAGWRLHLGATVLRKSFAYAPEVLLDTSAPPASGNDPDDQVFLRSEHELGRDWRLDVRVRRVDELPEREVEVPAYTEAEVALTWLAGEHVQLSLAGFDLLHASHLEMRQRRDPLFEIRRRVHLSARFAF